MPRRLFAILFTLTAVSASAQTPALTGLNVRADIAVSTGGGAAGTSTASTTKSHCSSAPFTADSQVFSLALVLEPQIQGLSRWRINGALADQQTPQNVYFITGTPVQVTSIQTSRRAYPVVNRYINELWIENLTWADASDILQAMKASPDLLSGPLGSAIRSAGGLKVNALKVTLPTTNTVKAGVDLTNAIAAAGTSFAPDQWSLMMAKLATMTTLDGQAITPTQVTLTADANAKVTVEPQEAAKNLEAIIGSQGLNGGALITGDAPANRILIVDSPCLNVALLPALVGNNVTGGTLAFGGRYLFPFRSGHSFARIGVNGESPIESTNLTTSLSQFGGVFDLGLNKDSQASATSAPVRFTGGLTATYDHANGTNGKWSKFAGGTKGSVSFANPMTELTGDDTRPTLTIQATGSSLNESAKDSTQFEGIAELKAKFRWTPIFNSAIDAQYQYSNDAIYGKRKNNYQIVVDVVKFIVRDPLEFAATWKCGRQAPDYMRVCGFYTGISLTSNQ